MLKFTPLLSLLLAAAVGAADPTITGKPSAEWLVELKVDGVEKGTAVIWDVYTIDGRKLGKVKPIPIDRAAVFAGPKGKYNAHVRLVKGEDVKELDPYPIELTGGPDPTPIPVPPTPVPPTPTPVDPVRREVSYQIVYVEDSESDAASRKAVLLTHKGLNDHIKLHGHTWRVVTKDNLAPDVQQEIKAAAGKGYPQVFLNDKAGKLKQLQFTAPTKGDDMLKLLVDNGG